MTQVPPYSAVPNPDRLYVSQFSTPHLGLQIFVDGALVDPDGDAVNVRMLAADGTTVVDPSITAVREDVGTYAIDLPNSDTNNGGFFSIEWSYEIASQFEQYLTYIEVGYSSPAYDELSDNLKLVVENVWWRFADLFDSPLGGPHLQTYVQTHFGRQRLAQILQASVRRMNIIAQPHGSYTLDNFPDAQWGGLLEQMTYVEALKHLRRSYVEDPDKPGVNVPHFDRRDYMARWGEILQDEQAELKSMQDVFKIANMGLGRPHVLVSGGVYGNYGPTRLPAASAAARPMYWSRFY